MPTLKNAAVPIVLDYEAETHEFEITVKEVTEISYILEYAVNTPEKNEDDQLQAPVLQAFTDVVQANEADTVQITQLAGSESSGSQYLHDVTDGSLSLTAVTTDQTTLRIEQLFSIEDGELQLAEFSQEIATDSAVLGNATDSAKVLEASTSTLAAVPSPVLAAAETAPGIPEPISVTPSADSSGGSAWAIGLGISIAFVVASAAGTAGWWWYHRRQAKKQTAVLG